MEEVLAKLIGARDCLNSEIGEIIGKTDNWNDLSAKQKEEATPKIKHLMIILSAIENI